MAKIRYTVRFYYNHDIDLITFIMAHEFDVMRAIYSAVTAFAKGEAFIIQIPPSTGAMDPIKRRIYTKALVLDQTKDIEAIKMIEMIKPGRRNNFFKNILRIYLLYPFSEEFFIDPDDTSWFENKLEAFRTGRKIVKAGKTRKTNRRLDANTQADPELSSAPVIPRAEPHPVTPVSQQDPEDLEPDKQTDASNEEDADAIMSLFDSLSVS